MGQENSMGSFLVGNFILDYSLDPVSKSMVVGVFAIDAAVPA
jgi:hypothetical protein